jgi:hypothetical protein
MYVCPCDFFEFFLFVTRNDRINKCLIRSDGLYEILYEVTLVQKQTSLIYARDCSVKRLQLVGGTKLVKIS